MKPSEAKAGMRVRVKGTGDSGVIIDDHGNECKQFLVRYHDGYVQWHLPGMLDPIPEPEAILDATLDAFAKVQG